MPTGTEPDEGDGVACVVLLIRLIEIVVSTDVNILALQTALTNHVWQHKEQTGLVVPSCFIGELFDLNESQ